MGPLTPPGQVRPAPCWTSSTTATWRSPRLSRFAFLLWALLLLTPLLSHAGVDTLPSSSSPCPSTAPSSSTATAQAAHLLLPTAGGFPHHSCTPSSPSVPQLFPSHAATQPLPLIYPRRKRKGEDWNHYMCELGMQCILDGDPLLAGFDEKGINNIFRALNRIRESDPSAYLKFQALEASLTEACIELQRDSMLY
mmetsp:Transcript_65748/g.203566  ORF Transcript_65748/g.203566 Transcript_65748/m.203566 type:complete len:195 (+) Transcript_65748:103-687(+)